MAMSPLVRCGLSVVLSIWTAFTSIGTDIGLLPERNLYPAESGATRVMTFNLNYKYDSDRMENAIELIGQYYPDSAGLQECSYEWYKDILVQLPEYGYVGGGVKNGTLLKNGGWSSGILYRRDTYIVKESGTFWLSETPDVPSIGWDASQYRVCTWAVLENVKTGKCYAHVNTHLDVQGSEAREKGLSLVMEKALSFDIPTVLTGDFNFSEESDIFKNVLEKSDLIYTKTAATDTTEGFTFHGYDPENYSNTRTLDYIYVNNQVESTLKYRIITDKIDGQLVSDHYPVYADLKLY